MVLEYIVKNSFRSLIELKHYSKIYNKYIHIEFCLKIHIPEDDNLDRDGASKKYD